MKQKFGFTGPGDEGPVAPLWETLAAHTVPCRGCGTPGLVWLRAGVGVKGKLQLELPTSWLKTFGSFQAEEGSETSFFSWKGNILGITLQETPPLASYEENWSHL